METIWPGRFFWSDLNQAWEETEGDWAPACDVEVTDELVEDALALLGLRRGYDAKTLESCYRKRARSCHPDKTGDMSDDSFRRLKEAFDLLKALCEEHELPSAPTFLLALTAPRRRWKQGLLDERPAVKQEFLIRRSQTEQDEFGLIRFVLKNAEALKRIKAAANVHGTPSEAGWKATLAAQQKINPQQKPLRKRRRKCIESDDDEP